MAFLWEGEHQQGGEYAKRTLSIALGNFHQDYDSLLSSANLTTLDIIYVKNVLF